MTKKFRIWDGQKFLYAKEKPYLDSAYNSLVFRIEEETIWGDEGEITIQQWTGLTDSQGVEIYEGDIVSFQEKKWEVKFKNFSWFLVNDLPNKMESWWLAICNSPKVIGNIFQNPELLEKC